DEVVVRACHELGLKSAVVPRHFPLELADLLRERGVEVRADGPLFELRRRSKTPEQIEGARRAQRATDAAMGAVRQGLLDGVRTSEELKAIAAQTFIENGCGFETMSVAHGSQTADPLDHGSGAIEEGEPIVVDLFPRDLESLCYADMTRTFCLGEAPARLVEIYRACDETRQ